MDALGPNLDALGAKLVALGAKLSALGANLDDLGANLEALGANLDALGANLAPTWTHLEPISAHFGAARSASKLPKQLSVSTKLRLYVKTAGVCNRASLPSKLTPEGVICNTSIVIL